MTTHASDEQVLAKKQNLFARLDALANSDEATTINDEGYQQSVQALGGFLHHWKDSSQKQPNDPTRDVRPLQADREMTLPASLMGGRRSSPSADGQSTLRRTKTTPARVRVTAQEDEINVIEDTPLLARTAPGMPAQQNRLPKAEAQAQNVSTGTKGKAIGKRKRSEEFQQVAEGQQVFRGVTMMFIPNNPKAPARRVRMQKAVQHGARLANEWSSDTSHIVVDRGLTGADVLKALKLDAVPANISIVVENYIADCIGWNSLVDATQRRYQIEGLQHQPKHVSRDQQPSEPSDTSLQLKPAKGTGITYEPRTPSKADEESVRTVPPFEGHEAQGPPAQDVISTGGVDALQEAINETKAAPVLVSQSANTFRSLIDLSNVVDSVQPSGFMDGENSRPSSSDQPHSGDEAGPSPHRSNTRQKKRVYTVASNWQHNFQCMQPHNKKDDDNPNAKTIAILQEMENYSYSIRDEWRTRAYRKAMATLRKQPHRITSAEEAAALPEIGERLAAKIEEIVWTNGLQRLENAKLEPTDRALNMFIQIYGVGFKQASRWIQEGYRTFYDILNSPNVQLTTNQKVGIEHYEDFKLRIPRPETDQLGEIVRKCLQNIDPDLRIMIGGSYRRGAKDSGDIDLIITKPDASIEYLRQVVTENAVPWLEKVGFLTAGLAVTSQQDGSRWHGACQLPLEPSTLSVSNPNDPKTNMKPWRRIDLLLVPWDELGGAMIYFTGNDIFNCSMRLLARRKGMRLNQRGLYRDVMTKGAEKLNEGTKISGYDERDIFEALGVPYRGPTQRDCEAQSARDPRM